MSRYGLVAIAHPWWRDHRDVWDAYQPSCIFNQNFAMGLSDDDLASKVPPPGSLFPACYLRPRQFNRQTSGRSEIKTNGEKFQVNLDVNQFAPDELSVKTVENTVVVHARHEEKSDAHGFISREFTRRYILPEGVEVEKVTSALFRDGILVIEAPRKVLEAPNERVVPIVKKEDPLAVDGE